MSNDVFNWPVQSGPSGAARFATKTADFGDGYSQSVGDGVNNKKQDWNITFDGDYTTAVNVVDFLDRHAGWDSFLWTNPRGVQLRYVCKTYTESPYIADQVRITATFEQVYYP